MFDKQKVWCKNKLEKGKQWVEKNKFFLGYATGIAATIGGGLLIDKIFEPKKKHGQIYRGDFSEDGTIDYGIGIIEMDRFGREHTDFSHTLLLGEDSKDVLFKQVEAAIAETKAARNKKD